MIKIFKNRNKVDSHMFEVCELTWHEGSTKDEVENDNTKKRQCC